MNDYISKLMNDYKHIFRKSGKYGSYDDNLFWKTSSKYSKKDLFDIYQAYQKLQKTSIKEYKLFELKLNFSTFEIEETFTTSTTEIQLNEITYKNEINYYELSYKSEEDITKEKKDEMYELILGVIDEKMEMLRNLKKTNKNLVHILRVKKLNKISE